MDVERAEKYQFDEFELDVLKRQLRRGGDIVELKPKAFDLLLALVENSGKLLTKEDLFETVWKDQFVEESNLTVNMSQIRRALGERANAPRFITTVSGQGYRFVADVRETADEADEFVIESRAVKRVTIEDFGEKPFALPPKTESFFKRHRLKIFGIGALAILITGAFFLFRWQTAVKIPFQKISIRRLTTNGRVQIATISPDGKLFAYTTKELEKSSLWLGYTAGGNDVQLRPPDDSIYHRLTFSPDSNQLYFSVQNEHNPNGALYRMAAFGGGQEKIADNVGMFSLSPDSDKLAVGRGQTDGKTSLVVSDLRSKAENVIATFEKTRNPNFASVAWSPDGKRLALSCFSETENFRQELIIADVSNGKLESIRPPKWRDIGSIVWEKNGEGLILSAVSEKSWSPVIHYQILSVNLSDKSFHEITNDLSSYNSFLSLSDDTENLLTVEHRQLNNLWVAPADNLSQARQITFGSFGKYDGLWGLDFAPDGRIIFTNSDTETQVISAMNADGTNQKELTSPGFTDSALNVSNDGRYIVFHSNRGGGFDIWRMDIDGGNLKQLTFDNQSYQPFVSPDSRYVYFKSFSKQVGELRRISIDGGEPEILNDKETSWGAFSPDGKYFAATYITDKRRIALFSAETNQLIKQFEVPKSAIFYNLHLRWMTDSRAIVYRDGASGYWSQRIEGGEPTKIEGLPKELLYTYAWSKDGKQFAFARGQEIRDVVLIQNAK